MNPIDKLSADKFTCRYQAQYFRTALDESSKQLILDYLREIRVYLSTKSETEQWTTTHDLLQTIYNILELMPRSPLTTDMLSLNLSIRTHITDLLGLISAIEANNGSGLGILYDFMPKFPHWRKMTNTRFKYNQRDNLSDYYYCGYVRDPGRENNIQKIIHSGRCYSFLRQIATGAHDFLCKYGVFVMPLMGALLMLGYMRE